MQIWSSRSFADEVGDGRLLSFNLGDEDCGRDRVCRWSRGSRRGEGEWVPSQVERSVLMIVRKEVRMWDRNG